MNISESSTDLIFSLVAIGSYHKRVARLLGWYRLSVLTFPLGVL